MSGVSLVEHVDLLALNFRLDGEGLFFTFGVIQQVFGDAHQPRMLHSDAAGCVQLSVRTVVKIPVKAGEFHAGKQGAYHKQRTAQGA